MVQEQCCSSGQWAWANICTEVSTPISWSGRAVSTQHWREAHMCHGSCCHPIHHTAPSSFWEESKRIPRPLCNSCHGCKGKGAWGELGSSELTAQASQQCHQQPRSCGWLLQGQSQPHGCRGMTCWQLRQISHLRLHHKSDNKMLKHKVTLNSYEFVTLEITPGGLAVLLHLPRTHRLDFSWSCVTAHPHHCFTLHLPNSATWWVRGVHLKAFSCNPVVT